MSLKKCGVVLVLLAMMVGAMTASASAATVDTKKIDDSGIIVTFNNKLSSGTIIPMSSSGTIIQGETQWRTKVVSGFTTSLSIGLYWGNPSNSLRLKIYAPDGSLYGPFYDNCDGRLDGFIPVTLTKNSGLPTGTYYIEIYGYSVQGIQSYTIY